MSAGAWGAAAVVAAVVQLVALTWLWLAGRRRHRRVSAWAAQLSADLQDANTRASDAQAAAARREKALLAATRERAEAQEALARYRAAEDAERTARDAYLVGTIRRAIWPQGDPTRPTTPGLAGLVEACQRLVSTVHAYRAAETKEVGGR